MRVTASNPQRYQNGMEYFQTAALNVFPVRINAVFNPRIMNPHTTNLNTFQKWGIVFLPRRRM
jgi:hypothetical protein